MKKVLSILLVFSLIVGLFTGCAKQPLDLNGEWKDDTFKATIKDDYITIEWNNEEEQITSLYWAGSVDIPKDVNENEEYTWTSKNDTEKTDTSFLASSDETKVFTYSNGIISFDYSALGINAKGNLKKVE